MPRLDGFRDVVPAHLTPTQQVLGRDQDSAIGSRSATGAAGQAVELFSHRLTIMARRFSGACGGLRPGSV